MEEKDSAISGPYEEFRICFCGKIPSGFVEWYLIDVSVQEACLSEKTESSTRELTPPFSVAKHLPSYAALGGLIYSLGGQRRSSGGGETLLNDVWLLNFESLEDLKPGSILPQPSYDKGDKGDIGEYWKPDSILPQPSYDKGDKGDKADIGEYWKPDSILPQPSYDKGGMGDKADIGEYWKPDSILPQPSYDKGDKGDKADIGEYWKPDSILPQPSYDKGGMGDKADIGEYWKPDSILPQPSYDKGDKGDKADIGEYWKPDSILPQPSYDKGGMGDKADIGEYWKPDSILPQPSYDKGDKGDKADIGEYWKPDSILPQPSYDKGGKGDKVDIGEYWKPDSILPQPSYDKGGKGDKVDIGEYWKPDSILPHWTIKSPRPPGYANWDTEFFGCEDWAFKEPKLETRLPVEDREVDEDMEPDLDEDWEESLNENVIRGLANWVRGLPMNFARYKPHTMVVDHKLYVLGGFLPNQKNQADGWIEVFDPEEKKWESLPSPPDQIHSSIMISGLLKSKKEIIIAKQRWDRHPMLFYSYNITTRYWDTLVPPESELSVHPNVERAVILPPNIGRAVTVGNTLYWISTEEDNHECTIRAYDLDRNMWFEDHLTTARIFGSGEYFSSIYSRGPGFLHLVDQKFCLLLQSTVTKDPQPSIEYLYCVILNISPIYEYDHEDWGKFERTTLSVQKYSMDHYIDFLDCMLLPSD